MTMKDLEDRLKKTVGSHLEHEVKLDIPDSTEHGDYSTNACLREASRKDIQPYSLAEEVAGKIDLGELRYIEEVEAAGHGFLNFFLKRDKYTEEVVRRVVQEGDGYGKINLGQGKIVVLDFSHPNIGKPLHIGHLRSTIIGDSLKRILGFCGHRCIGINHLGDMGTQFGKLIYAYKNWGDEERLEKDPIGHLLDLYVRFHDESEANEEIEDTAREWSKRLEEGDPEAEELWKKFTEYTKRDLRKAYERLNVDFDSWKGERFFREKSREVIEEALEMGVAEKDEDGSVIIRIDGEETPYLIQRSDGGTLYSTRDLAAVKYRKEQYGFDLALYVVGVPQERHFKNLFQVARKMGYVNEEELVHVKFGMMSIPKGSLSTRKGNLILLEEALDRAKERALEAIKEKNPGLKNKNEVAEKVGIGAIKYLDLSKKRTTNTKFSWDKALSFEGSSGPYLQYSYTRAHGILDKTNGKEEPDFSDLEQIEFELAKKMGRFHHPIIQAVENYEPHRIATYLNELCELFNEFYHKCRVKDSKHEARRVELVKAFKQVLGNGLDLLNIPKLEEM